MQNQYPAIDILQSVSRVMNDVISPEHKALSMMVREYLAVYRDAKDLIDIGAYTPGSNSKIDAAIAHMDRIQEFIRQGVDEHAGFEEMLRQMQEIIQPSTLATVS